MHVMNFPKTLLILTRFNASGVYDVIILLPSRDKPDKHPQPGCLRVADSQENIDIVNTNKTENSVVSITIVSALDVPSCLYYIS